CQWMRHAVTQEHISGIATPCHLVEWYRRESVEGPLETNAAKLDVGVASLCAEGSDVRLLAILAVPTDEVVFGVFAGSADDVARTCTLAGLGNQLARNWSSRLDR